MTYLLTLLSKAHTVEVLMEVGDDPGKAPADYVHGKRTLFLRFRDLRDLGIIRVEGDPTNVHLGRAFLTDEGQRIHRHLKAIGEGRE